tara:strand:+ start:1518 stop:1655 length:138 start_codon:yes stop_codon:yes gene_type:complete
MALGAAALATPAARTNWLEQGSSFLKSLTGDSGNLANDEIVAGLK